MDTEGHKHGRDEVVHEIPERHSLPNLPQSEVGLPDEEEPHSVGVRRHEDAEEPVSKFVANFVTVFRQQDYHGDEGDVSTECVDNWVDTAS